MKIFTLKNKHIIYYADIQAPQNFNILMQLYCIVKAETSVKQLPLLPLNDFRQPVPVPSVTVKQNKVSLMQFITGQLHAWTDPLFKRTAA